MMRTHEDNNFLREPGTKLAIFMVLELTKYFVTHPKMTAEEVYTFFQGYTKNERIIQKAAIIWLVVVEDYKKKHDLEREQK